MRHEAPQKYHGAPFPKDYTKLPLSIDLVKDYERWQSLDRCFECRCINVETDHRRIDLRTDRHETDFKKDRRYMNLTPPQYTCCHGYGDAQSSQCTVLKPDCRYDGCMDSEIDQNADLQTNHECFDSRTDYRRVDSHHHRNSCEYHECIDCQCRFIDSPTGHQYTSSSTNPRTIDSNFEKDYRQCTYSEPYQNIYSHFEKNNRLCTDSEPYQNIDSNFQKDHNQCIDSTLEKKLQHHSLKHQHFTNSASVKNVERYSQKYHHQVTDSAVKDSQQCSRKYHRYVNSNSVKNIKLHSEKDHNHIDSVTHQYTNSNSVKTHSNSRKEDRHINTKRNRHKISQADVRQNAHFSYLIASILISLTNLMSLRLSKHVISVRRSWLTVAWLAWLVVGCGQCSGMAMSSDQTDTDTFKSICDEPGCLCTSGRITCYCTNPDQAVLVSSLIPATTSIILIENCATVEIERNALRHARALTQINIANVPNLKLNEHSFSWEDSTIHEVYTTPGIHINLTATTIPTLPTYVFRGRIDSILFDRVQIGRIESYAFTNIVGTEKIEFKNSLIGKMDTQAFKKLFLDKVTFTGGAFLEPVPSKAMLDIEIRTEFKLDGLSIDKLHSSAFKIARAKTFYLKNCIINDTEGEAFYIKTTGPVFILNNIFKSVKTGAFIGLRVDENFLSRYEQQELIFENNTISAFEKDALIFNTSSFEPQLQLIKIDIPCSCGATDKLINDLVIFATHYPYQKTKPDANIEEFLWCQNSKDKNRYKMVKEYRQKTSCLVISTGIPTYILTAGFLVIPIVALGLLYTLWWRKKKLKWLNVPTESPVKNGKRDSMIIMPEGKTYRETELHVIIEKAEPIVEYIPENGPRQKGQVPPLTSDL